MKMWHGERGKPTHHAVELKVQKVKKVFTATLAQFELLIMDLITPGPARSSAGNPLCPVKPSGPHPSPLAALYPASSLMNVTFHLKLPGHLSAQLFPNSL